MCEGWRLICAVDNIIYETITLYKLLRRRATQLSQRHDRCTERKRSTVLRVVLPTHDGRGRKLIPVALAP